MSKSKSKNPKYSAKKFKCMEIWEKKVQLLLLVHTNNQTHSNLPFYTIRYGRVKNYVGNNQKSRKKEGKFCYGLHMVRSFFYDRMAEIQPALCRVSVPFLRKISGQTVISIMRPSRIKPYHFCFPSPPFNQVSLTFQKLKKLNERSQDLG